ncbi:MAG TPA: isoamylase early set domain-containing protein [Gemmatimonadaceae bacterium]|nr:isoamylase early set domain-containing protein [Gemmatimonadaceae bacterium]
MRDIDNGSRDDEFADRIAQPLRAPEVLAPDFEARLMVQARAEVARQRAVQARRSWWMTRRMVMASPLAGLALAAGIAALAAISTLTVARRATRQAPSVAVLHDTVQLVRFVFADSSARTVSLVGDFNGWARERTPLHATARAGVWAVSVPLTPGRHEYAFIVNGERWVADPLSPGNRDEFGTESSVLLLASNDAS